MDNTGSQLLVSHNDGTLVYRLYYNLTGGVVTLKLD